jgi:TonB family protein
MIRATVVLLIAHLVIPRLRRRSASARHLCWVIALGAAAIVPLLATLLPAWQSEWARRVADTWPAALASFQPWSPDGVDVVVRATGVESAAWTIPRLAAWLWGAGAAVAFVVLGRDAARLLRVGTSASDGVDPRLNAACLHAARMLQLRRPPTLLLGDRAAMPMTWGWRRPRVLLPAAANEWPDDQLHAVLAHELAHVRRADWIVHVLAQVVSAIYWFHPLFWTAEHALARESEQAADDEALSSGIDAGQYAAQVVALVRQMRSPLGARAPVVAMARTPHLERRVAAMLRTDANRAIATRRRAVLAAVAAAVVVVPLATMAAGRDWFDVDVRTVEPPATTRQAGMPDVEPMLPVVRAASGRDPATALPAIAEYTTPPLYSDLARRGRVEGIVTIGVRVSDDGQLLAARVVRGLGAGLDQNALVALRQWRFVPATRRGRPVAMDVEVDIEFSLQHEAVNELIANDMATLVGPDVTPPRAVRTSRAPLGVVSGRGSVVLDVVLLQDGTPKIVRILQSLNPDADEQAVRYFEQWRFTPAMKDGAPVKVRMNAEVRFHG